MARPPPAPPPSHPPSAQGRRRAGALLLTAAVLAAHVLLWRSPAPGSGRTGEPPQPGMVRMTVRQVLPPEPLATPATTPPAAARQAAPAPNAAPLRARPAGAATAPVETAGQQAPPRYATRPPAAQQLHYRLWRDGRSSPARLRWQPDDTGYTLALEGVFFGRDPGARVSRGVLDADGVAPLRYVESRRGREQRAVNFQRDKGLITWSAAAGSAALQPGAQDRLSWIAQLAAVLEANEALREPPQTLQLPVAGVRGEAEVWQFSVQGRETLALPGGPVAVLLLRREPARAWDWRIEAWLDPLRGHLPVQLRFTVVGSGQVSELRLHEGAD